MHYFLNYHQEPSGEWVKPKKIVKLQLNTFRHNSYKTQECAVVSLYLEGLRHLEATKISALTSPSICSPLPSAVKLSTPSRPSAGWWMWSTKEWSWCVDFYWNFVTGDVVKSSEGPVAIDSKLGWTYQFSWNQCHKPCLCGYHWNTSQSQVWWKNDELVDLLCEFWNVESLGILSSYAKHSTASPFPPRISFLLNQFAVEVG